MGTLLCGNNVGLHQRILGNQAKLHEASHRASSGDRYAIKLEIETISRFIKPRDKILDIECANGFSTFRQCELHPDTSFIGVDYAEIEQANKHLVALNLPVGAAQFSVASILDLPFEDERFNPGLHHARLD